jgi:hypothetical protein
VPPEDITPSHDDANLRKAVAEMRLRGLVATVQAKRHDHPVPIRQNNQEKGHCQQWPGIWCGSHRDETSSRGQILLQDCLDLFGNTGADDLVSLRA